jgi:glucose/arabinose dehydrogenase
VPFRATRGPPLPAHITPLRRLPARLATLLVPAALLAAALVPTLPLVERPASPGVLAAGPTGGEILRTDATGVDAGADAPILAAGLAQPGFIDEVAISGLDLPTAVAFAADGKVYVAEKRGIIKEYDSISDATPTIWADLRTDVYNSWDRGLLGMALDPSFTTNHRIYVAYTRDALPNGSSPHWGSVNGDGDDCPSPPGPTANGCVATSRIAVLTGVPGGLATTQVLITDWCQQYPSHSVSDLAFGPDGKLYAGHGDGASYTYADYGQQNAGATPNPSYPSNPCGDPPGGVGGSMTLPTAEGGSLRSQDLRTATDPLGLDGTIIRIDPATGAGVAGNPGFASSDANERRIIAYGLRNPFRLAFRPGTSELWFGDVGQVTVEELNRLTTTQPTTAVNFGWPCKEGFGNGPSTFQGANLCSTISAATQPYFAYLHAGPVTSPDCSKIGQSSSISGIAFETGGNFPTAYDGALFIADYSRDCIWVLPKGGNGLPDASAVEMFGEVSHPVQLKFGPDGYLYYVDLQIDPGAGNLRRIKYQAPNAVIQAAPTSGSAPLHVAFDASASTPSGLGYAWDLDGDGQYDDSTAAAPSWDYAAAGEFTVRLRVTSLGQSDTASTVISVGNTPPVPSIATPSASLTWAVGDSIAFSGSASDAQDGTLPPASLQWALVLQHCPSDCHEHVVQQWSGVASGSFTAPDHEYPAHLTLRLTATDQYGAATTVNRDLQPRTGTLTLSSDPLGVTLGAADAVAVAPFTATAIQKGAISISAPATVVLAGRTWYFSGWSDGGAAAHEVVVGPGNTGYLARYATFSDAVSSPFATEISWATINGITAGCDATHFCPTSAVTRGQMAAFLVRALGLTAGSSPDRFGDIATSSFRADVNLLATAGITGGCGAGRYCPDAVVTREQMASFLVRALELTDGASPNLFNDIASSPHRSDINRLATAGITGGCGGGRYCPAATITREQMVAFLYRALH